MYSLLASTAALPRPARLTPAYQALSDSTNAATRGRLSRVLVTDGDQRSALAIVRSLGRAGYIVAVASLSGHSMAGASRYAAAEIKVADPLNTPHDFVRDLRNRIRSLDIGIVLPVTEPSLLAVLRACERPDDFVIPWPGIDAFRRACDKAAVLELARDLGIATPAQQTAHDPTAARAAASGIRYPVVLKPSRSVTESADARAKHSVRYAQSRDELLEIVASLGDGPYPLLIQERIDGPGIGIFLLRWNGQTIATFAHRRLREKPPSGGVSVYCESIVADSALVRLSENLLDRLDWNGVAMVEYKMDRASGTPYLMEVNPRFWGSLQLAVDAGVDFPRLLCDLARGETPVPVRSYSVGVRSRWWWGDVDQLITRVLRPSSSLALPPDAPSRLGAIRDFLRWRPTDRNDTLQSDDPRPFWREAANRFSSLAQ